MHPVCVCGCVCGCVLRAGVAARRVDNATKLGPGTGLTANTAQARELLEVLLSTHKGAKPPLEATAQTYASLVR